MQVNELDTKGSRNNHSLILERRSIPLGGVAKTCKIADMTALPRLASRVSRRPKIRDLLYFASPKGRGVPVVGPYGGNDPGFKTFGAPSLWRRRRFTGQRKALRST